MSELERDYDVVVIGGGPAGATCASLVAQAGHRVALLEREQFPRFKVGESLMPATFSTLQRLGMLAKLEATAFPRKHSVQFFAGDGRASAPFYFSETNPGASAVTWQVLRSEFDVAMIANAEALGATVAHGADVRTLRFADGPEPRAIGVSVRLPDGRDHDIDARVVVDASGQSALIARRLGLLEIDERLRHASIYSHFEGAVRDPGIDEGATLILHTRDHDSWFWYIPLPEDRVSVGVVGSVGHLLGNREEPQAVFDRELRKCPGLIPRLDGARQVYPMRVVKDFSYTTRRLAGDGWVLIGDACGFLDPIYSSGVLLALRSGEFAADTIHAALVADDPSAARLGAFAPRFRAGMNSLRSLVYAFYAPGFSFSRFLKQYPQYRAGIVDLLTGDVFDRDHGPMLEAMDAMLQSVDAAQAATAGHESR